MKTFSKVIALDGPSGSGKSTIAKEIAKKMGIVYIDTGAMFRAIGLTAHQQQVPFEEGEALIQFIGNLQLEYGVSPTVLIRAQGQDLTHAIREHHVSELASQISKLPTVRNFLLAFQRQLGSDKACVMEGRDIGTVVFPDSFCKIFMTASNQVRGERRLAQLKQQGECNLSLEQIIEDIIIRDQRDSSRDVAPLKPAEDSIHLDTSHLTFNQVLEAIVKTAKERAVECGITL